jgi:hypothetical protein
LAHLLARRRAFVVLPKASERDRRTRPVPVGRHLAGPPSSSGSDSADGWVEDRALMRRLVDRGSDGPDLVECDLAEQIASRYGVEL